MSLQKNHLQDEKSPYLKQYASSPILWYPWGEDAFLQAKKLHRPIFLSIGYATSHLCQVMGNESFFHTDIAALMNSYFINVKVDKEELPVISNIYSEFASSLIGEITFPLNILLTPILTPFFATTYIPPYPIDDEISFVEIINQIHELWTSKKQVMLAEKGEEIIALLQEQEEVSIREHNNIPAIFSINQAVESIYSLADPLNGGLKLLPKRPFPYHYAFLLRYSIQQQDSRALFYVTSSLEKMVSSGLYDHIDGGFYRSSNDQTSLVPCFEKNTNENASMTRIYLETFLVTGNILYKIYAKQTVEFLLNEMSDPQGGFYVATDARSLDRKGEYYLFQQKEIDSLLSTEEFAFFSQLFTFSSQGSLHGKNILTLKESLYAYSSKQNIDLIDLNTKVTPILQKISTYRKKRAALFTDKQVITETNGILLHTLSYAGCILQEERYLQAAVNCAQFIYNNLYIDNTLYRRWIDNEVKHPATFSDFAFLIHGLIAMFETGLGKFWLDWAIELSDHAIVLFKNHNAPFYSNHEDPYVILRSYNLSDANKPSANAIHSENLIKLYNFTQDNKYLMLAQDILDGVRGRLESNALHCSYHFIALQFYTEKHAPLIFIALNEKEDNKTPLQYLLYSRFLPFKSIFWIPYEMVLEDKKMIDGKTTVYIKDKEGLFKAYTDIQKIAKALEVI